MKLIIAIGFVALWFVFYYLGHVFVNQKILFMLILCPACGFGFGLFLGKFIAER